MTIDTFLSSIKYSSSLSFFRVFRVSRGDSFSGDTMAANDLVLALTGASGAPYGVRLLEVLLGAGRKVHLVISPSAVQVIEQELDRRVRLDHFVLHRPAGRPTASMECRTGALSSFHGLSSRHRQRFVPHRRHDRLSVQHGHRLRHRPRPVAEPHPPRRRRAFEGTPPSRFWYRGRRLCT